MVQPKVSVVVPIYNVEPYLSECVDSLLSQTLSDIEIILVDDGSPDRCGDIADEYAKENTNIKVIHQNNSGLGPARNSGMMVAEGEYIGFVDSDDWVKPEMFEQLYKFAAQSDADICIGGHCDVSNGTVLLEKKHPYAGKVLINSHDINHVREQLFGHLPEDDETEAFPMQVWTSIYRRDFILSFGLRFRNILSEDTMFNLDAYKVARAMVFTAGTDYCYRMDNQPSIMRSFSENKLYQYENFVKALYIEAENSDNWELCCLRVKRAATQYVRLYAGLVENSGLLLLEKKRYLHTLSQSNMMKKFCAGYPLETLPVLQRIFQQALENGHFYIALLLLWTRRMMKKGR